MTKSKQTASSSGTREALLLAGERLIAENGIDAVSLRQINTAAGQRNSSAAHYHFGSKEALVRAIFEYRMERVNSNRQSRLKT
ncbi:MAG: TetR family transcriptional regulator, partial [Chromatiales bacterium]|nr:TetR family transcriptional regulator [Chromatiales bacterium]